MSRRTGRRPGQSGTRDDILDAARASFTENGYSGATIRGVARRARVDPALVHHYFGSKRNLFIAAIEIPVDPTEIIATLLEGDEDDLGERIANTFLRVWDGDVDRSPMVALIRSATTDDRAAAMFREFILGEIFAPIIARLGGGHARLRATLVASQLMGVALMRYVIGLEPLASSPRDQLANLIAPTLQRYLKGNLGVTG
jgi:AcrR family transcriptional regulator